MPEPDASQLTYWSRQECTLELLERGLRCLRPREPVLRQQAGERCCDSSVSPDKAVVVASKAKEAAERMDEAWVRPKSHCLRLLAVHRDVVDGHDVPQVQHGGTPNAHLDCLRRSWCRQSVSRTRWTWRRCFDQVALLIQMSLKKTRTIDAGTHRGCRS